MLEPYVTVTFAYRARALACLWRVSGVNYVAVIMYLK